MPKSHYLRGLSYAVITATLWGFLPILMKIALKEFSGSSIVWFRFAFAFGVLFCFLKWKNRQPESILLAPPGLGILSGLFLAANYYCFLIGVDTSSPSNAGVLIQTAPVLLVVLGVVLFKERFNRQQGIGLAVALIGFILFYRDQSGQWGGQGYTESSLFVQAAALLWVGYMVIQKKLAGAYEAQSLNLLVYGTAAVVLIPAVTWADFDTPHPAAWGLMVFLGLNTLLAYGFLAEAVKYIPLWLLSVVITLNPFITLLVMHLLPMVWPGLVAPEVIGLWGYVGAGTAIGGVVMVIRKY
ncbi:MAG: EamA family transporter [Nitrospinaceae bacterium]|nr:DMT family transporter [Nitrospinaceae bacterium]NIR57266.1 DMT family transporter [Nitrospinaceae bacterium]NIS87714.1 DMT family transporter [Nitrospinaceae bacterium]NIT84580.1 DMT family transporter [Nitrospinaceae bacterium]NIU46766.1 DMT family transporter [Nitrospinaceae bacterium]